jgi:hypothetical protein
MIKLTYYLLMMNFDYKLFSTRVLEGENMRDNSLRITLASYHGILTLGRPLMFVYTPFL